MVLNGVGKLIINEANMGLDIFVKLGSMSNPGQVHCTTKKSKDEAIALFDKNHLLLGLEENKEEKDHLMEFGKEERKRLEECPSLFKFIINIVVLEVGQTAVRPGALF